MAKLTQQQLEAHLWGAANILRGKTAGQDYKNYILSLMFYKRLCDQWENEADEAIAELERQHSRNHTGDLRNVLFDYTATYRGWDLYPGYIGLGFFVRGERLVPGPFGALNSAQAFGGIGAGSTAFWVDPKRELTFALLTTGLMEDSFHLERVGTLSDMVVASLTK